MAVDSLIFIASALIAAVAAPAADPGPDPFKAPVRLKSGADFIDVEIGHAAPFVHDHDGDGVRDLLVGQFGQGKLRIYRNVGTNEEPRYDGFEWFTAGLVHGTVPAG